MSRGRAKWTTTGWRLKGGRPLEHTLFLPAHIRVVVHRRTPSSNWYWWIGASRAQAPDDWPGHGPYKSVAYAKMAAERGALREINLALVALLGKPKRKGESWLADPRFLEFSRRPIEIEGGK